MPGGTGCFARSPHDPENLQIMYGIAGERELGEAELDWLPGYENSAPVRVGNGAAHQLQLDVYGEVTEALHLAHMTGLTRNDYASLLQLKLIRYLEKHWDEPDEGIWEVRGPPSALRSLEGDGVGRRGPHDQAHRVG